MHSTYQDAFSTSATPPPLPGLTLASTSQNSNQISIAGPSSLLLAHLMPTNLHTGSLFNLSGSNTPNMLPLVMDLPVLPFAAPTPTLSDTSFPDPQKCQRISCLILSHMLSHHMTLPEPWNLGNKEQFESCIARITAAANFPLA